jgi:uncharacterized protein YgiM (DUF1202 family)
MCITNPGFSSLSGIMPSLQAAPEFLKTTAYKNPNDNTNTQRSKPSYHPLYGFKAVQTWSLNSAYGWQLSTMDRKRGLMLLILNASLQLTPRPILLFLWTLVEAWDVNVRC